VQSEVKVERAVVLTKRVWEERADDDVPTLFFPVWLVSRLKEFINLRENGS
jgi:hypothetical protein